MKKSILFGLMLIFLGILNGCNGSGSDSGSNPMQDANNSSATPDTTPPVITLKSTASITITVGGIYTDAGATASDNVDGNVNVSVSGSVDSSKAGTYTLTYTAKDSAGNTATKKRTVMVVDTVKTDMDIARAFGIATQGTDSGYRYYEPASNAIDGNITTYNHTSGKTEENWLQIALPKGTEISKIMVKGRSGYTSRLKNAKVAVTTAPYGGTLVTADIVKTLEGTDANQTILFDTPKSGDYLIIKAQADNNLHVVSVEVYGKVPKVPYITPDITTHPLPLNAPVGTEVVQVQAIDYRGDPLTYSIDSTMFSIDTSGTVHVAQALTEGSHRVTVAVSDGSYRTETTLTITVTPKDAIAKVLASGDVVNTLVTEAELFGATRDALDTAGVLLKDAKIKIFNLNSDGSVKSEGSSLSGITWDPTHDAALIKPTYGVNTPLLVSNAVSKTEKSIYHKPLAIIGQKGGGKYVLFASNPMRTSHNAQMDTVLENTITWLTGRSDLNNSAFKVVIAHLNETYWFKDESSTRRWLDNHYSNVIYSNDGACDDAKLAECINGNPDLLIVSQDTAIDSAVVAKSVNDALANGIPVLYLHLDGDMKPLGKTLFDKVFDVSYEGDNYWKRLMIENGDPSATINDIPEELQQIKTMITHLENDDYAFDWSKCNGDDCSAVVGLESEFLQGANAVKSIMKALDAKKKDIFKQSSYRLQKLLVLTADKIRQSVTFPMSMGEADDTARLRSLFADYAVYNYRTINPVQPDMGNFSRSDFSHITPKTLTLQQTSKEPFKATGVYCLPGQTIRVTRTDSDAALETSVFINSLRSGATHEFNTYNRPKFLQSTHIPIEPGETIYMTSPYGGPVEIAYGMNDHNATFKFENVGQHPFWRSPTDDATFANALATGEYDWAELATGGFEVHSKLDKMRESIKDWANKAHVAESASELANATRAYIGDLPFAIAGYRGEGISMIDEVKSFADNHTLTIHTISKIKHMNADQATCGYGCSGNPYDAYWAFSPIGHGDIHEVGHGLEGTGIDFDVSGFHSTTNPYSYYTKTQFNKRTGYEPDCQSLPFKHIYEELNASATLSSSDRISYLNTNLWKDGGSDWSEEFMVTLQAMIQAQKYGSLTDGYDLLALNHIIRREASSSTWDSKKANLGFGSYTYDEYEKMSKSDFELVALSYITSLDYRPFFDMFGLKYSQKASDQVDSNGFTAVTQKVFFVSTPNGYCKKDAYGDYLNKQVISVDGTQSFPY